ncbi:butyrophilin-like protein 2 [Silurus asotus]|uniref:Butyrophilin-like protein 2 n=1 Tax=Silurus asotus TaxID=30991 RepID=A0AAD5APX9_SILAS|nr:butyrophilin-like protein 2 [Silurus asotus]
MQNSYAVWSVVVLVIGSGLVVFVNAAALLVELILKAHLEQKHRGCNSGLNLNRNRCPTPIKRRKKILALGRETKQRRAEGSPNADSTGRCQEKGSPSPRGPSGSLTVQLGDSVMLPCFVETPLPVEDLEVEWKRTDSGSLVHLWQNGESRPESQNQRYHERAHFFSEEVAHGNFSLLLTIGKMQEFISVYNVN